jgi:hypothetical protein
VPDHEEFRHQEVFSHPEEKGLLLSPPDSTIRVHPGSQPADSGLPSPWWTIGATLPCSTQIEYGERIIDLDHAMEREMDGGGSGWMETGMGAPLEAMNPPITFFGTFLPGHVDKSFGSR